MLDCLGKIRCALAGGNVSLGVGFEVLKVHTMPSLPLSVSLSHIYEVGSYRKVFPVHDVSLRKSNAGV